MTNIAEFFSKSGGCLLQLFLKMVDWNLPSVHPLALVNGATHTAAQHCRSDDFCPGFLKAVVDRYPEVEIERLIWEKDEDWYEGWKEYYSGRRDGLVLREEQWFPHEIMNYTYQLGPYTTIILGNDYFSVYVDRIGAYSWLSCRKSSQCCLYLQVDSFVDVQKLIHAIESIVWPIVPLDQPVIIKQIGFDRGMWGTSWPQRYLIAEFPHWPVAIGKLSRGEQCFLMLTMLRGIGDSIVF